MLAAWTYLAAVGWPLQPIRPGVVATLVFLVGFAGTFAFNRALRNGPADDGDPFRAFLNACPNTVEARAHKRSDA